MSNNWGWKAMESPYAKHHSDCFFEQETHLNFNICIYIYIYLSLFAGLLCTSHFPVTFSSQIPVMGFFTPATLPVQDGLVMLNPIVFSRSV